MKKTVLITLFAITVFIILASFTCAEKADVCKVTFRMPQGHHYVIDKGETYPESERYEIADSLVLEVKKGHVLTAEDVEPYTHHCTEYYKIHDYCKVTTKGWDREPIGTMITEDTEFTAVMNEDTCNVTVRMNKGFYEIMGDKYESFTIEVDKGYRITERDIQKFSTAYYNFGAPQFGRYEITAIEPNPGDSEVTEDVTFAATAMHIVHIQFAVPDLKGGWNVLYTEDIGIREDKDLKGENLPEINYDKNTVISSYWNISDAELAKLPASEEDEIWLYAYVSVKGDCNYDMTINTADAVCILKAAAGITQLNDSDVSVFDADSNSNVNTADGVYILRYAVGMIDEM